MAIVPKTVMELKEHIASNICYTAQDIAARRTLLSEVVEDLAQESMFDWLKPQPPREIEFVNSRIELRPPAAVRRVQDALIAVTNHVVDKHAPALESWALNGGQLSLVLNEDPDAVFELYKELMAAFGVAAGIVS